MTQPVIKKHCFLNCVMRCNDKSNKLVRQVCGKSCKYWFDNDALSAISVSCLLAWQWWWMTASWCVWNLHCCLCLMLGECWLMSQPISCPLASLLLAFWSFQQPGIFCTAALLIQRIKYLSSLLGKLERYLAKLYANYLVYGYDALISEKFFCAIF